MSRLSHDEVRKGRAKYSTPWQRQMAATVAVVLTCRCGGYATAPCWWRVPIAREMCAWCRRRWLLVVRCGGGRRLAGGLTFAVLAK